jgi:phosphinothricin acetyltransferase
MEHSVVLAPEARGAGLGRALMHALEEHARAAGVHCLIAGVSAENPSGLRFHGAIGFEEVARLPEVGFKNGRFLDLVLMQKML